MSPPYLNIFRTCSRAKCFTTRSGGRGSPAVSQESAAMLAWVEALCRRPDPRRGMLRVSVYHQCDEVNPGMASLRTKAAKGETGGRKGRRERGGRSTNITPPSPPLVEGSLRPPPVYFPAALRPPWHQARLGRAVSHRRRKRRLALVQPSEPHLAGRAVRRIRLEPLGADSKAPQKPHPLGLGVGEACPRSLFPALFDSPRQTSALRAQCLCRDLYPSN
jgi:hypothetical protein